MSLVRLMYSLQGYCIQWIIRLLNKPGTSYVLDDNHNNIDDVPIGSGLKYDRSGPVPIILVPQPSDDPNDPLVSLSVG